MDLITTHVNADFDALGALVAAKKLYPDSRLLLPGSQERAVREFLSLTKDVINVESERGCSLDGVNRLILVDTRHKSRIGIASQLIDKGVEVHIYDHHPRMKGDVVADKEVYEEVGATVTILTDIIRKRRIKLSYIEATLILLGIYEETGSLTYRTTTKRDVDMVSFLLSQGANLSVVTSYLNRELSEEELSFLTKLINATERVVVNGVDISMIEVESESFVGELGMLIHKLLEIENIPVLFVFIKTQPGRVNIIARSKVSNVDVNKVMSYFGGGGHSTAASAKVQTDDVKGLKAKLIKVLKSNIKEKVYAKDIMSHYVKTVSLNKRIDETKKILSREKISGVPVVEKARLVGIITIDNLNKAIRRGFGHSRVKGYMSRPAMTVRPKTPIHMIQKIILERDVGILPVLKKNKIVGIVNRMDVLKEVHKGLFSKPPAIKRRIVLNLSKKMSRHFSKEIMALLRKIGTLANSLGYSAFIVGGIVRDLLLGVKNLDLDIVIEGDAIEVGRALSQELKGAFIVHRRFGTATVVTKEKLKIDLATARKELYEKPAALPTVEFSSLKNDLVRRDFTINAMAVSLNKASFGQLIDFFGGERDLLDGRISVLHDGSFIDDPTRIFRAVRFESRFGFYIDSHTEDLIRNAIEEEMFDKVHPQRIRDEVILLLKEEEPLKALKRMQDLHELRFIHPKIRLDKKSAGFYDSIEEVSSWYEGSTFRKRSIEKWLIYLIALLESLSYKETLKLCNRYAFRRGDVLRILSYKKDANNVIKYLKAQGEILPSRIYSLLEPLSFEVILLIMAKAKMLSSSRQAKLARSRIKDFFEKYNGTKIRIKGGDLEALGLKPGPKFRIILKKVLYRRIDGALKSKRDELEYAKELMKRI